jgi:iron complex outermembrane receptor protein
VLNDKVDITGGLRFDYENKQGDLTTSYTPQIAPPVRVSEEKGFSNVSPQVAVTYRPSARWTVYGATTRGFKAGGFNPASPSGSEIYDEELTWNVEGGVKAALMDGRVTVSAAVFNIDWDDLQLNLPNPFVPGQFYIANAGGASSRGVEFEAQARVAPMVDVFGSAGYTNAQFGDDAVSSGVPVGDNDIPYTPKATASVGTQINHRLNSAVGLYGRAELTAYGSFKYDDLNREGQDAYTLTNLRFGARGKYLFAEGWIRNAFDTNYIPVAFAYGALAPSGYIGEMGRPRTFGLNVGVTF